MPIFRRKLYDRAEAQNTRIAYNGVQFAISLDSEINQGFIGFKQTHISGKKGDAVVVRL